MSLLGGVVGERVVQVLEEEVRLDRRLDARHLVLRLRHHLHVADVEVGVVVHRGRGDRHRRLLLLHVLHL